MPSVPLVPLMSRPVQIIAHRGASHDYPENTLGAVQLAFDQEADACEIDVQFTRDRRLAVMHDDDTCRTAGVRKHIAASDWKDLSDLEVAQWGKWRQRGFSQRIPLLEDVIAMLPKGKQLFIEIKAGAQMLIELKRVLIEADRHGTFHLISFDLETMRLAKRSMPDIFAHWIVSPRWARKRSPSVNEMIRSALEAGLDGLDLRSTFPINAEFVHAIHSAGLKICTWTVDDPTVARAEIDAGVDGITTNRPMWLRKQLGL